MSFNDQFNPDPADFVIIVMGLTGTGKTNFINKLAGNPERREAGGLVSDTQHVTPYPISYHPSLRVVLVDTPGFDNTHRKDSETLELITDWLTQKYPDWTTLKIAGIIYFHRITDNSMSGSTLRSLDVLRQLCGDTSLPRTRLVTTMWDQAKNQDMAAQRETQLISKFWRDLIAGGALARRFHNSSSSAWDIVEDLLWMGSDCDQLLLQEKLVKQRERLNETEVAKFIYKLQKELAEQKKTLKGLEGEVELQNDPNSDKVLQESRDKTQAQAKKTSEELKEMKIPPMRRNSEPIRATSRRVCCLWRKISCKSC
ncbi:P-loop containing nucleoside triphosphate hydrolase protein [Boletus edulis]|nr:P-loop containing nucleoside triphosphate hydrolase protein [Boletus edulis]